MASRKSKVLAVSLCLAASAAPALAQNYSYADRSDTISITAGDANAANLAIQTPTPWPSSVNNTTIRSSGKVGEIAMQKMVKRLQTNGEAAAPTGTVINIGTPSQ